MGFSLILRAFFSFPNERQFIECQFFWEFRVFLQRYYRTSVRKKQGPQCGIFCQGCRKEETALLRRMDELAAVVFTSISLCRGVCG